MFEADILSKLIALEHDVNKLKTLDGLDSTAFGRPVFLTTQLTSTSWDGDSFSTTGKTLIDLSTVFGVPAGVKAVYVYLAIRDSASSTTDTWLRLSGNNAAYSGVAITGCHINDVYARNQFIVPCDSNGDIYYEICASGTDTMDVYLHIWGYWL